MEILERIWESVGLFFSSLLGGFERTITAVFGSSNARYIKTLQAKVDAINNLESKYQAMSDEDLRAQTSKFRERLDAGETLDDILVEAFAVCREGGRRYLAMRHYDVQLMGGMVLHSGSIAEMVTGEGKTLVATLPTYLNAIEGKGVHVVTVNDYLARRDMEWMAPLYMGLGLTVGAIQGDMQGPEGTRLRQEMYARDITYGTNNEFGFDYLRDNMRPAARGDDRFPKQQQQSQGKLNFAIIDEVDNILIDEARTPLIISGPAFKDKGKYSDANRIALQLKKEAHFVVNEKDHSVNLTDEGVREAEKLAGVESFYTAGNMEWPHLIDNALKAHHLYKKDVNYVIKDGGIVIVDEFTGRMMEGRQWSDGLHQAVEAKEGVRIKDETQTLATITLQNFFKLYGKLCGMTGTAMTEANEFWKIYKLDVVAIPTNRELQRIEYPDSIFSTENGKYKAVAEEIERHHKWDVVEMKDGGEVWCDIVKEDDDSLTVTREGSKSKDVISLSEVDSIAHKGRPILVGTVSIEKSERVADLLTKRGIKHEVLNAKNHKREAEIVAQAGRPFAVTIATNMAGRGTDIVLGGNPETMAWARLQDKYETRLDVPQDEWDALVNEIDAAEQMKEKGEHVKTIGGLHVIGTERHESRRIDLQLRGRTGRQGDPGSSRFFLSLEDDLMRIFAGPWVKSILERLGMQEDEAIEHPMVSRRIEGAQKKVEERNFESRKNLLEYDEVMDEQRKRVYGYRQKILDGVNCRDLVIEAVHEQVEKHIDIFLQRDYGVESFAKFAGSRLSCQLEPRDFRGMSLDGASEYAKEEATRQAEAAVLDAIEENLPQDAEDEWNWEALARLVNTRWGANVRDRDLKKIGRDMVDSHLFELAGEALQKIDLSEGAPLLQEDFGVKTAVTWAHHVFGVSLPLEEVKDIEAVAFKEMVCERAEKAYAAREAEYPVMAGFYRFGGGKDSQRLDRDSLVAWARERFEVDLTVDEVKNKQRPELAALLIEKSTASQSRAMEAWDAADEKIEQLFHDANEGTLARDAADGNGALDSLTQWLEDHLGQEVTTQQFAKLDRDELTRRVSMMVEDKYRPEIRRMERHLLLEIVDDAWKGHLLAMDHLKSSIGLVGYAQMDAKVEYKREGMRLFESMWESIGERIIDLVFRMEQLDEQFVGSTWVETSASHAQAQTVSEMADAQQQAIDNSGDVKVETIRNRGDRVGRNDPCPCGSGKKYKNCCLRSQGVA
ncbi:MAG: preprotein translocase subunit SecA [Blastopirellula sp.]|nr:preprotein translocase subunit SecA [Blastopirellula sp.]